MTKYLMIALLVAASVAFTGWQGYKHGVDVTNGAWAEKVAKSNADHAKEIKDLYDQARANDALANVLINSLSNDLESLKNEIYDSDNELNRVADRIAGLHRITANKADSKSAGGKITASAGECYGTENAEFSEKVFNYLYGLMQEADAIVLQLSACQELIRIDRKIVDGFQGELKK